MNFYPAGNNSVLSGTASLVVGVTPIVGGTSNLYFYDNNGVLGLQSQSGSGLQVGTSTITGGTNGYVLYDNNGVIGEQPLPAAPYQTATGLTAGFSVTVNNGVQTLVMALGGVVSTGTVQMMASPPDGQMTIIKFSQTTVQALTIAPNAGQSVVGSTAGNIPVGATVQCLYVAASTTWYC